MNSLDLKNPIAIAQALVKCPSVTPNEGGALGFLSDALSKLGFDCTRLPFSETGTPDVDNLYAELKGTGEGKEKDRHLCFAGHTDVVPVGDVADWNHNPFAGKIDDIYLHGRGVADMKGGIAAFVAAVAEFTAEYPNNNGKISLLITGDEEGPAINGTKKMLKWLEGQDKIPSHCIVGEPTNPNYLGEMMKVGRRGSLNGVLSVNGTQGHVAYPHLADNPIPKLLKLLLVLEGLELDKGSEFFQPSNLEIVSIDVGNTATNVIPAKATAKFNIRFNDKHSGASLIKRIKKELQPTEINNYNLDINISGESFITEAKDLIEIIAQATKDITGNEPEQSTTGGTSDARFISQYCPVIEFGAIGKTMHKIDEKVKLEDLTNLSKIYKRLLELYFMPL